MNFIDEDNDSTNIMVGTNAELYWKFYTEALKQMWEIEEKMKLYAKAYYGEVKRAHMPLFLNSGYLKTAQDKDEKPSKISRREILEGLLGKDFLKAHKVTFESVVQYGSYAFDKCNEYDIEMICNGVKYRFAVPNINNAGEGKKDYGFIDKATFAARYEESTSVWEPCDGADSFGYDWAKVAGTIKKHIESTAAGKKVKPSK